jgi:hypothetical protein
MPNRVFRLPEPSLSETIEIDHFFLIHRTLSLSQVSQLFNEVPFLDGIVIDFLDGLEGFWPAEVIPVTDKLWPSERATVA